MKITVIIVTYNSAKYIEKCLNSLIQMTVNMTYEIVIVDNASTDNTVSILRTKYSYLNIIVNKINKGFAKAVNQAIKVSKSEYILLLNPDAFLQNNVIEIFYQHFQMNNNKNVACAGGSVYSNYDCPTLAYGFFPSLRQIFFEEFGFRKLFTNYYFKNLSPGCRYDGEKVKEVDYICGANLFFRRNLIELIGYFDEDFFLYYEETEFCYRAKKQKLKNILIPQARIMHYEGKSVEESNLNIFKLKKTSELLYFRKCHGILIAKLAKLFYLIGSLVKFVLYFESKQFKIFKIVLKS